MEKTKESKQIRISLKEYEQVRKIAYKTHKPMTVILEELIRLALKDESKPVTV